MRGGITLTIGQPRGPSIRSLDETYGSRWRRPDAAKKSYMRRKFIWLKVIAASEDLGIPPEQAAKRMDSWRSVGRPSSISLNKLNDMLSAVAKDQTGVYTIWICFNLLTTREKMYKCWILSVWVGSAVAF